MKKILTFLLMILCVGMDAQYNRTALATYIQSVIYTNGMNTITGATLQPLALELNTSHVNILSDTNLLDIRLFSPYATYTPGMGVFYGDSLFMNLSLAHGTWNYADWIKIAGGCACSTLVKYSDTNSAIATWHYVTNFVLTNALLWADTNTKISTYKYVQTQLNPLIKYSDTNSKIATYKYVAIHGGSGIDTATYPTAGAASNHTLSLFTGTNNIVTLGTIGTGTWHGSLITGTYGGTGVNNGSNTITIAGSLNFQSNAKGYAYNHGGGIITYDTTRISGGSGWSLTGNSGTTPGTNFVGTTDAEDLEFKSDNILAGYIAQGGHHTTYLGSGAGLNSLAVDNCTVVGWGALNVYASGSACTAVGVQALNENSANNCTAIGFQAGDLSYGGANNTFVGASTNISSNSYTDCTALGYGAMDSASYEIKLGDNNIKTVRLGSGAYCLPIQVSTATSGTVASNGAQVLRLTGAATSLTITMPASPVNGQLFTISTNQATITLGFTTGATLDHAPSAVTYSTGLKFIYDASTASWGNL